MLKWVFKDIHILLCKTEEETPNKNFNLEEGIVPCKRIRSDVSIIRIVAQRQHSILLEKVHYT